MDYLDLMKSLHTENSTKIVLLVMDGLGGLPSGPNGATELEAARTPNLDGLASRAECGLSIPIAPGITPGSGPSHLALFGYDPLRYEFGRGILEVLGVGFPIEEEDLAARGNFCTVDDNGIVVDRRAGRIPTEKSTALCELLQTIKVPGLEVIVLPVREHRFGLVFRGDNLDERLSDTDPQATGRRPLPLRALAPEAQPTAELISAWVRQAEALLANHEPANMFLLRGFSKDPRLPKMADVYGLKAAAIATYPMYRGVAQLVGMDVLDVEGSLEDEIDALQKHWTSYDYFYVHVKYTDSRGEDGDFEAKARIIEQVDQLIPNILQLEPDVLIVTGDHSTPAKLKAHSWHPVPTMIVSHNGRCDRLEAFSERACARGSLGRFYAVEIMPMAMANALRLEKYGA